MKNDHKHLHSCLRIIHQFRNLETSTRTHTDYKIPKYASNPQIHTRTHRQARLLRTKHTHSRKHKRAHSQTSTLKNKYTHCPQEIWPMGARKPQVERIFFNYKVTIQLLNTISAMHIYDIPKFLHLSPSHPAMDQFLQFDSRTDLILAIP
jgi:hypothetical protein